MVYTLVREQQQFIRFVSLGDDIKTASGKAGVSRQTAHRWMRLPAVQEALATAREGIKATIQDYIKQKFEEMGEAAAATVADVMMCDSPAARLKAAQMVLDRVSPLQPAVTQAEQSAHEGRYIGDLKYWTGDELATLDEILHKVEQRKEAELTEQGIMSIRKAR